MGLFVCLVVMFKRVAVVSGVLGTVGMGIGYYRYKQRLLTNASVSAEVFNESQQEALQPFLEGNADHFKGAHKTLYQYSTCPFCSKLRAFLDYHGVQYDTKEVNPLSKAQIASHGYHKVPQLQVGAEGEGGPIIVDSSEIVKLLKPRWCGTWSSTPTGHWLSLARAMITWPTLPIFLAWIEWFCS